ncbi:hypothetical protein ABW21_db0200904 [Orbilia brochopaga]|nr:hypothetical protein ABW21_db0200904 [Drechslerella brochopaga]
MTSRADDSLEQLPIPTTRALEQASRGETDTAHPRPNSPKASRDHETTSPIVLVRRHSVIHAIAENRKIDLSGFRGDTKVLRDGSLAYILEFTKAFGSEFNQNVRMVFGTNAYTSHKLKGSCLSLTFAPDSIEFIEPPSLGNEHPWTSFFKMMSCASNVDLEFGNDAHVMLLQRIDTFFNQLAKNRRADVSNASGDKNRDQPSYHIVSKSDYFGLHHDALLAEIAQKQKLSQRVFGGTVHIIGFTQNQSSIVVKVQHLVDKSDQLLYTRVDSTQDFILTLPNGSALKARWPESLVEAEYLNSPVVELEISGASKEDTKLIRDSCSTTNTAFELTAAVDETSERKYNEVLNAMMKAANFQTGFPIGSIIFSHVDRAASFAVEEMVETSIQNSNLNQVQKDAVIHAISDPNSLPSGLAVITGPAGTGKTLAAAFIAKCVLVSSTYKRILVTAKQNRALQRIFMSIVDVLGDEEKKNLLYVQGKIATEKLKSTEQNNISNLLQEFTLDGHLSRMERDRVKRKNDSMATKKRIIFNNCQIILATPEIILRDFPLAEELQVDIIMVDEAAAISEIETCGPIIKYQRFLKRVILIGDSLQLQPYSPANNPVTKRSLLTRLQQAGCLVTRLTDNNRMVPDLAELLRKTFYNAEYQRTLGLIKNPLQKGPLLHDTKLASELEDAQVVGRCVKRISDAVSKSTFWVHVDGLETKRGTSFCNLAEQKMILRLLGHIISSTEIEGVAPANIGVITPYQAQVSELRARILETNPTWLNNGLTVATIDSYQGNERDVILISMVRGNDQGELGFINNPHRLCCAAKDAKGYRKSRAMFDFLTKFKWEVTSITDGSSDQNETKTSTSRTKSPRNDEAARDEREEGS